MQITCPQCKSVFNDPGTPVADGGRRLCCPQCRMDFIVQQAGDVPPDDPKERESGPLPDYLWDLREADAPARLPEIKDPLQILKKYFGYQDFRLHQLEIIEKLIAGEDLFVLMPTGSGKSICYQIPAMIREGLGLVISPLIALMQDQVQALRQIGVRAACLNSSLSAVQASTVEHQVLAGELDLLYVAPERLLSKAFGQFLRGVPLALFAIDEAHCVSQWGHDFRPEYLGITEVTRQFEGVPRVALTATADPQTRQGILTNLDLTEAALFISSFDRPNIRYRVALKHNDKQQLLSFLQSEHAGAAGIVYVRTRKRADQIAAWLQERGVTALPYHAGLDQSLRLAHQQRFLREEGLVMVATIAFGMGIDKPDVRFVAHLDLPSSVEAYYQETGRAGRDGQPADAWMVYSLADVIAMRKMLESSEGDGQFKMIQLKKLEALLGYCETVSCRRQLLLDYFGEEGVTACGNCDTCLRPVETWDATTAVQMALSCVFRTGQRFGAAYLTDVLMGKTNERMERFGHHRIKTFGVGREIGSHDWRSIFRQLAAVGLLSVNMTRISGFRLTEKSWPVLKGQKRVRFRKDPLPVKAKKRTPKKTTAPGVDLTAAKSVPLWEKLRALRMRISKELEIPPFVVFHDRTLAEFVEQRPVTREQFLGITGVGEKKAEQYGELFMEVIRREMKG